MSTFATADLSSDDEHDADFQLPEKPKAVHRKRRRSSSNSGTSSSGSDADSGVVEDQEKLKLQEEQAAAEADERKRKAEAAFIAMREQDDQKAVTTASSERNVGRLVEVRRARRFAGETLYETVMLPADDPEATAYLSRAEARDDLTTSETSANVAPASNQHSTTTQSQTKPKKPARRKPRQSLEAMSAALDKGKKMTTLEKSQMDWKSHTSRDKVINDELQANRRAGGYLQKRDFLDRVEERRTGTFEERRKAQQ